LASAFFAYIILTAVAFFPLSGYIGTGTMRAVGFYGGLLLPIVSSFALFAFSLSSFFL
jgi:hypothetical protein